MTRKPVHTSPVSGAKEVSNVVLCVGIQVVGGRGKPGHDTGGAHDTGGDHDTGREFDHDTGGDHDRLGFTDQGGAKSCLITETCSG